MNDPYSVIGVSPSATDEEVKSAYRELVKKYHPDNYANNPLADLASEKMKEINEAYDEIMKMREGGSRSDNWDDFSSQGSGSGKYPNIREMITRGQIAEAQSILDAVPLRDRDAEWHFLMGSIMYRKGWINEAYVNFQNAYQAEPNNPEYRKAVERLARQSNGGFYGGGYGGMGRGGYSGQPAGGCNACDMCSAFICADCLTDACCGGGGC